jgi:hypothetical protein
MASFIFLGSLYGAQYKMDSIEWMSELDDWRGRGAKAIIAKGNIIAGIEAKE